MQIDSQGQYDVKVGFNEPRRKQYPAKYGRSYGLITNAMIGNVIESGKKKAIQGPRAFIKPAVQSSNVSRKAAMQAAFDKEIQKL